MIRPAPARHPLRALARAASWHRRKLAVVAAVAAVLLGISAARPPDPPQVTVLRAVEALPAGRTLTAADLRREPVPAWVVPDRVLSEPDDAVGKSLAGPVPAGQMITASDLLTTRASSAGRVVAPLRLEDTAVVQLLSVGERVDVLATGTAEGKAGVVASGVQVVGLPRAAGDEGLSGGDVAAGALVLVEVDVAVATTLADAAATGRLSVVMR